MSSALPPGWRYETQIIALVLSADWFLSDQQRRHQALAAMAAPEALKGLQAAQDEVAGGVAHGPFGVGRARRGVRSVLRSSLLGYQVVGIGRR